MRICISWITALLAFAVILPPSNLVAQAPSTIGVGWLADIIAVEGDPTQEIEALQAVRFVMVGGRAVWRAP